MECIAAYESSDDEDETECLLNAKASVKRVLLPEPFEEELPAKASRKHVDEAGKVRQFAHQEGNWACHVYIEVDSPAFSRFGEAVLSVVPTESRFHKVEEVHLSVSRTFPLRTHEVDSFMMEVRRAVVSFKVFSIELASLRYFVNDDASRSFVAVCVDRGKPEVCQLISLVDKAVQVFGQPVYYKNPIPHVSLAWCAGDIRGSLGKMFSQCVAVPTEPLPLCVTHVVCKCGNRISKMPLRS